MSVGTLSSTVVLETKNIIVATGPAARMLPGLEPDPERVLTNVEILSLERIPQHLVVIGAGAVGVEFASIYDRFGSKVTLIEMLPRLVPLEDEEVSKELQRYFRKTGIRCETGATADLGQHPSRSPGRAPHRDATLFDDARERPTGHEEGPREPALVL